MPFILIAHADWSVASGKRFVAVVGAGGVRSEAVEEVGTLLDRLVAEAGGAPVLLGVDAPIGLPEAYAAGLTAADFPSFLHGLTPASDFFRVCREAAEITPARPFFPYSAAGRPRREMLAAGLGVDHHAALLRRCDRSAGRAPAACLFWTLGANQVGKAALSFWRDVLLPAGRDVALWPFEGTLEALLATRRIVVAEAYPAEALRQLGIEKPGSKRRQADRAALAPALRAAMARLEVRPDAALAAAIADGFGARADGEDRFDSVVGLLGMLQCLRHPSPVPASVTRWEGWILGQSA